MIDAQDRAALARQLPARTERRLLGIRHDARGRVAYLAGDLPHALERRVLARKAADTRGRNEAGTAPSLSVNMKVFLSAVDGHRSCQP